MSRLGVLYAIDDVALEKLRQLPEKDRYDFMLEEIEPELIDTPDGYELDKAWEGIQYCLDCLGSGAWNERNALPTNVVFAGEFLVQSEDSIITLKCKDDVKEIASFLEKTNLSDLIRKNFLQIPEADYTLPKDDDNMEYLLSWSNGLNQFYRHAADKDLQVIFTVDL